MVLDTILLFGLIILYLLLMVLCIVFGMFTLIQGMYEQGPLIVIGIVYLLIGFTMIFIFVISEQRINK